ncbi:MAG: tyrosine-type recombinase/integrase [Spirochaetales bacterium]|nr:tyrosine-type recombinase/integrase [Spirochaetales bacterium]
MGLIRNQMIEHMKVQGYSDKTIDLYTTCIAVLSRYHHSSPLSLVAEDISDFLYHLRVTGRCDATVHMYVAAIKYFYRLHKLPAVTQHLHLRVARTKLPAVLGKAEVRRLLSECRNLRLKTIMTISYSAGLRISETLHLKKTDIDIERKTIFVRNGKGGADRYTLLGEKSLEILTMYIKSKRTSEWLFPSNTDPSRPISAGAIQKQFRRLANSAGFDKAVRIHTLRHSFATHLMEDGTNLFVIMRLLGHAQIQTTMRYLHLHTGYYANVKSPIDTLPNALSSRPPSSPPDLFYESA